ncbi:DUF3168 domain-containing protein, partial [Sphingomonas sp.]
DARRRTGDDRRARGARRVALAGGAVAVSAREVAQAAVVAALRVALGDAAAVFDAPPVRAALPHVVVEQPELVDWSTKDWRGREGRIVVAAYDGGERPVRLRALAARIEDAVEAVPAAPGDGWRVATLRFVRSRVARAPGDRWVATSEFVVRLYREGE